MSDRLKEYGHDPDHYARPDQAPLRRARRRLVFWTFVLGVGAAVHALRRPASLSPGPLSRAHRGSTAGDCTTCHSAAALPPTDWLGRHGTDAAHCLECHDLGPFATAAHGRPPTTNKLAAADTISEWIRNGVPDSVECGACHFEHRGIDATITQVTDAQCNTCHDKQVRSFPDRHPEFDHFGASETGIRFDHAAHQDSHFEQPVGCDQCHTADNQGRVRTHGFEVSCATCHQHTRQLEGSVDSTPQLVLQIPGIDTQSLARAGIELPFWRVSRRRGGRDIPPIMSLLIAGAETYPAPGHPGANRHTWADDEAMIRALPRGLADLRQADPATAEAIERAAWAVRALILDLAAQTGTEALRDRLERLLGRPLNHGELADLSSHMPRAALRAMADQFFPRPAVGDDAGGQHHSNQD